MEPISPSVWRRARWNTVRRGSAVRIARGAYQGCPPRVVHGWLRPPGRDRLLREPDRQAPALTQADVLRAPFVTRCRCLGMGGRQAAALALNGTGAFEDASGEYRGGIG